MKLQIELFRQRRATPGLGLPLVMLLLFGLSFCVGSASSAPSGNTGFIGQLENLVVAHTVGQSRVQKPLGSPELDSTNDGDPPFTTLTAAVPRPGLQRLASRLHFDALLEGALADTDHHRPPLRAPPLV